MSEQSNLGRREFLKNAAVGGAAVAAGLSGAPAILSARSPNDRLQVACIGVGTRGHQLLQEVQRDDKVDVAVICDLYKGNIERAKRLTKNADVRLDPDWQKTIADPKIDAVVIGTPDFWHAPMVIAAAKAKKDIYVEKGWSKTLAEAKAMRKAVKDNKVVMQLGHHYNSEPTYHKAREIYQSGQLGKVTTIRLYIDRAGPKPMWKFYTFYNVLEAPKDASPETIDWARFIAGAPKKLPFDVERFFTWRCWWDYGTGIAGDLMSHLWDGANMVAGMGIPGSAVTQGGNYIWKGDRDVPDVWHVAFDYPKKEMQVTFGCDFSTTHIGEITHFLGADKTLEVGPNFCRTFPAEWKPENRKTMVDRQREIAQAANMNPIDIGPIPDYSYKRGEIQVSGHMLDWTNCIRTRETPRCGVDRAFQEAATIAMSVEAFRRERKVKWDAVKEEIV